MLQLREGSRGLSDHDQDQVGFVVNAMRHAQLQAAVERFGVGHRQPAGCALVAQRYHP